MDKLKFVQDGAIKLPPGFRFQPTDEEIVFEYLTRKIYSCPLPASVVPEISVCKYDPWDFPGDGEQDRYFFTKNEAKYRNGNRTNRATSSGYWKATGSDKSITCPRRKHIMGMRKTLVFYRGKPPNGSRTDWIMHEYRLVNLGTATDFQRNNSTQNTSVQMENWVLCRMFLKKRSRENDDEIIEAREDERVESLGVGQPRDYDFMKRDLNDLGTTYSSSPSSSSSCGSSAITEVTSIGLDHEQTSSSGCNSFSPYR